MKAQECQWQVLLAQLFSHPQSFIHRLRSCYLKRILQSIRKPPCKPMSPTWEAKGFDGMCLCTTAFHALNLAIEMKKDVYHIFECSFGCCLMQYLMKWCRNWALNHIFWKREGPWWNEYIWYHHCFWSYGSSTAHLFIFFLDRCQLEITQTSWAWTEIHKGIFEKIFWKTHVAFKSSMC